MGANRRYGDPLTALAPPAVVPPREGQVRHVVVNLSREPRAPTAHPGVLVAWRRAVGGWEAQVAYVTVTSEEATLHVTWVLASQIAPFRPQT